MSDETDAALAARKRELETLDRLSQRFGRSLSDAFQKNVSEGRRLDGVLSSLARSLAGAGLKAALAPLRSALRSGLEGILKGAFGGGEGEATPFARGGVIDRGRVRPFAAGGVVASPTYFPMQGGVGLMGEAGAEAIMPLARGPDGRLGVRSPGGRGVSVQVTIVSPDAEGFRRSEAQVTAALARAVERGRRGL